jgi:hypothetical protein
MEAKKADIINEKRPDLDLTSTTKDSTSNNKFLK